MAQATTPEKITLNRDFVNKLIKGARTKGQPVTLWNGLPAKFYRLDNKKFQHILKVCEKPWLLGDKAARGIRRKNLYQIGLKDLKPKKCYLLEVSLGQHTIYLIFNSYTDPIYIVVNTFFSYHNISTIAFLIIYNGIAYHRTHPTAKLLLDSINRKIVPELNVLLTAPQTK